MCAECYNYVKLKFFCELWKGFACGGCRHRGDPPGELVDSALVSVAGLCVEG